MPVSHQLKCVFVHVPRTGGTSIESALGLWGDWRQENTSSLFGMITSPDLKRRLGTTPFLQHLTASELGSVLPREFQRYYRFAFVRNPWDRLVSIRARMDQHMHAVAQSAGLQLGGTSFDQFLELTQNFEHVQLAPQHGFILDSAGDLAVDFLGRFERLATDFTAICARLGLQSALPHRNASKHGDYRPYYDCASRRVVERRYGDDIERFQYLF
jgi:chondroitin 4-sulfotransferase 11